MPGGAVDGRGAAAESAGGGAGRCRIVTIPRVLGTMSFRHEIFPERRALSLSGSCLRRGLDSVLPLDDEAGEVAERLAGIAQRLDCVQSGVEVAFRGVAA